MKISKLLAILLILAFPLPGVLRGEWFDGEVQKVDAQAQTITVSEIDPITDAEEKKEILIDKKTAFSGVTSFKDIRIDDNVTVEAKYDEPSDVWRAISVEVAEAGA